MKFITASSAIFCMPVGLKKTKNTALLLCLLAISYCSNAQNVGIGTTTPHASALLHINFGSSATKGFLVTGDVNPDLNESVPDLGAGSRMMFYPAKRAFRVGYVDGTQWNNSNVAYFSTALGRNTIASANMSTAMGFETIASGTVATAIGDNTIAKAYNSFSAGAYNDNIDNPFFDAASSSDRIFQIGNGNSFTRSNALTVLRNGNLGIGTTMPNSSALLHINFGSSATKGFLVTGDVNPDLNESVPDLGAGSRMMFYPAKRAFRVGYVDGTQWNNSNVAYFSTALGRNTIASANMSTAMGFETIASGTVATAIGDNTIAKAYNSFSAGAYNDNIDNPFFDAASSSDRIFQIGNGNSFTRSNAMTVLRNGNVGIGTTTPAFPLSFANVLGDKINLWGFPGNTNYGFGIQNSLLQIHTDAAVSDVAFGYGTSTSFTQTMRIYGNGNALLSGTLTQNSDATLKRNIIPINLALSKIMQLTGYTYYWNDNDRDQSMQTGVIAQEVEKVMPELVKKDEKGIRSVNYSGLIPVLIESIKEQQKMIDKQQKEIDELKKHERKN